MIFDGYLWVGPYPGSKVPATGINLFLRLVASEVRVEYADQQIVLRRLSSQRPARPRARGVLTSSLSLIGGVTWTIGPWATGPHCAGCSAKEGSLASLLARGRVRLKSVVNLYRELNRRPSSDLPQKASQHPENITSSRSDARFKARAFTFQAILNDSRVSAAHSYISRELRACDISHAAWSLRRDRRQEAAERPPAKRHRCRCC